MTERGRDDCSQLARGRRVEEEVILEDEESR